MMKNQTLLMLLFVANSVVSFATPRVFCEYLHEAIPYECGYAEAYYIFALDEDGTYSVENAENPSAWNVLLIGNYWGGASGWMLWNLDFGSGGKAQDTLHLRGQSSLATGQVMFRILHWPNYDLAFP
jgi:hypothetical protein